LGTEENSAGKLLKDKALHQKWGQRPDPWLDKTFLEELF
jgi:hypothetical protein